jgi:hypothetical protein
MIAGSKVNRVIAAGIVFWTCLAIAGATDSFVKGTMQLTKKEVERAMEKHILSQGQLMGVYKRK